MQDGPGDGDALSSLLSILVLNKKRRSSIASVVSATTIDLLRNLLYPEDYISEVVVRLSEISDVLNLLDFILHVLRDRHLTSPDGTTDFIRRARRLMIKIISTNSVIPRSLIVTGVKVPAKRDYIGRGGYGGVCKGKLRGKVVALKTLYKTGNNVAFCREALMWATLKHEFVLSFLGIYEKQDELFLVSPYMENGTLAQWRKGAKPSVAETQERILEVAYGMEYIHSEDIVHGDLRGDNVLLDANHHVQIADFGLTRLLGATNTRSGAKCLNFSAPELFGSLEDATVEPARTQMSDVYAFGCLYYEIYYDSIPFAGKFEGQIATFLVIQDKRPDRLDDPPLSDGEWELIQQCWAKEPWERPRMTDVVESLTAISQPVSLSTNARTSFSTTDSAPSFYENPASGSESTLIPTTEEIQKICPRFRILLIGKSGAGKTSLINEAFGARVPVSNDGAGKADINYELFSEGNDLFRTPLDKFLNRLELGLFAMFKALAIMYHKEQELRKRLHAIWLCLEVPAMGSRLLEGGSIEFLSQRSKGLIHVPIIVVFTKFDKLVNEYKITLMRQKDSDAWKHALQKADEMIEEDCAQRLRNVAGEDIRYLAVSNKKQYSHLIRKLVELTFEDVYQHVASEPSILAAMAQRPSIDLKIRQSIQMGKKSYWKAVLTGTGFGNTKIDDILRVVHVDIVKAWNLKNPKNLRESKMNYVKNNLIDPKFYNLMFAMVSDLGPTTGNDTTSDVGLVSTEPQRKFMAYIIDLTYIMYILFQLTLGGNEPYREQPTITGRLIKATYMSYYDSPLMVHVHSKIREYNDSKNPIARVRRDHAFELIEELLHELLEPGPSSIQAIENLSHLPSPQEDDEPW